MRHVFLGALLLSLLACSKRQADAGQGAERSESPLSTGAVGSVRVSPPAPVPAATASVPARSVALSEPGVRSLVEAWVTAQNAGDFGAYEQLYADRFTGIKRVGEYKKNFARRAWMADRAFMFKGPVRVAIDALEVSATPTSARVRFQQSWSSGTYKDEGPKEMVVIATAAGPRIAREEMLASKIVGEAARSKPHELLLMDGNEVVLAKQAKDDWARGAPREYRLAPAGLPASARIASREVDESRLPEALSAIKGKPLRVLDAKGESCVTKLVGFRLHGAVIPHFGTDSEWRGLDGTPPVPEAQIASAIWELSEGNHELRGVIQPACPGLWAAPGDAAPPAVYAPQQADPELRAAAIAAFAKLPGYQRIQRSYKEQVTGATSPWYEHPPRGVLEVSVFAPQSGPELVVVGAQAGNGCNEFGAGMNAVFERSGGAGGALVLLESWEPGMDGMVRPATAFDADGDGHLEILTGPQGQSAERVLLRRKGPKLTHEVLLSVLNLDCPC